MVRDDDEFEGIDIQGPWGGVRIGSGGVRVGRNFGASDESDEYRRARRRVRERLNFYRNLTYYIVFVGALALIDWATGGGWWVQWVAAILGAFVALDFLSTFVAPALWGRETEERMVRQEMERRRGSVHVQDPPDRDS